MTEALIGFLRCTEAGVLAHCPEPPAIHVEADTARVWVRSRVTDGSDVIARWLFGTPERLDWNSRGRGLPGLAPVSHRAATGCSSFASAFSIVFAISTSFLLP